jgi:vacuolar-type H+-ATPase subunit I/STV1
MKPIKIFIILLLTIFGVSAMAADVYTWVDKNGVRHFSDSPPADVEDAKEAFPEYQHDESADQNRTEQDQQQINSLIKEIEADDAKERAEEQKKAEDAERNRKPTREELIAAEKERLDKRIAYLEEQPLEYFGSQRNKIVRIGYYRYRLQDLIQDPDKYFNQPASFEGNVKEEAGGATGNESGGAGQ